MKIVSIIKYRLHRYIYSSRPIIPLIVIICLFAVMYSMKPGDVCSSYILSGWIQFVLVAFVALSINGNEETVDEQLLLLRAGNGWKYYFARELTLIIIACFYGMLLTLEPVAADLFNDFSFFTRKLSAADVTAGSMVIFGSSLAGAAIGDLLHPRIIAKRKLALSITLVLVILSIVKDSIIDDYRFLSIFGYLFPSVMKPARDLGNGDYFDIKKLCAFVILMALYYTMVVIIKNTMLIRKKFD